MERLKKFELTDEMLDNVSGGYSNNSNVEYGTCQYCAGYLIYERNGVAVPPEEIRCEGCGYMPTNPDTIPRMDGYGVTWL